MKWAKYTQSLEHRRGHRPFHMHAHYQSYTLLTMYHQMNAELFPGADSEANPEGYNHALLNATMQTVRVALQDDVINVYRVRHMLSHIIFVMYLLISDPLVAAHRLD